MHIFQVVGMLWIYNKLNYTHFILSKSHFTLELIIARSCTKFRLIGCILCLRKSHPFYFRNNLVRCHSILPIF